MRSETSSPSISRRLPQFLTRLPFLDPLLPPRELRGFSGGGEFRRVGKHFLDIFIHQGKLKPSDRVLDVGCGIGRMAVPLTRYLGADARYEGFDVYPKAVDWCKNAITKRYPNFQFSHVDLHNSSYNATGKLKSTEFIFPYADNSFDFVFLTSVFTHLLPAEVDHYLKEITRVLTPGGRCLATFFVWNDQNRELWEKHKKKAKVSFEFDRGDHRIMDQERPMIAVAYPQENIREMYRRNQLNLQEPFWLGRWCGRTPALTYQDCLLAYKKNT